MSKTSPFQRARVRVYYSGRVQGVGFRYSCREVAKGYSVTGTVRNLEDGRVELIAEGEREELDAFLQGIQESHLKPFIKSTAEDWLPAGGDLKGFSIVR